MFLSKLDAPRLSGNRAVNVGEPIAFRQVSKPLLAPRNSVVSIKLFVTQRAAAVREPAFSDADLLSARHRLIRLLLLAKQIDQPGRTPTVGMKMWPMVFAKRGRPDLPRELLDFRSAFASDNIYYVN